MGSFISKWDQKINSAKLSQRVMDKVKPEAPLRNKIEDAQKKLQLQVTKLSTITEKLQQKHDVVFKKIIEAQKTNNHTYARAYAIELAEIRKMGNMVNNAKLAMEQIQIRLNTVSELGDVVVTLSPCMSVIKGLGATLGGIMPDATASMQDLSNMLSGVLSGASLTPHDPMFTSNQGNAETLSILEEAQSIIEGQTKKSIPEVPFEIQGKLGQRKETLI